VAPEARGYCPVLPFGPSLHPRGGTLPSADSSGALRQDCSSPSRFPWPATSQDSPEVSRGKPSSRRCIDAGFIKHAPLWMEDLVVACPLVPGVPHLLSGSCSSPRTCAPRFLQPPPHGDALALRLSFGSPHTWTGDFHPLAVRHARHTRCASGAGSSRSEARAEAAPRRLQAVVMWLSVLVAIIRPLMPHCRHSRERRPMPPSHAVSLDLSRISPS
jgi:hypothetical protein